MSQSEKKRKRTADQDDLSSAKPSKAQRSDSAQFKNDASNNEGSRNSKKGGKSKQKKSERKSKKQMQYEKSRPPKPIPAGTTAEDGLATGEDFVAFTDINDKQTSRQPATKKGPGRSKGVSPRMVRKRARDAKNAALAAAEASGDQPSHEDTTVEAKPAKTPGSKSALQKSRFIVFVGNLPYDATTEQVQAHFAKLQPASIRHQTDKKTGQSKGFAFLEFTNYDRMKTCLQLYHHSMFDPHATAEDDTAPSDGNKQKSRGRKLNVELTAGGGGGKSTDRKTKIREKNKKLAEERERTKAKQLQKKAEAERARILKAEKEAKGGKRTGANAQAVGGTEASAPQAEMGDIHPSRLGRVTH